MSFETDVLAALTRIEEKLSARPAAASGASSGPRTFTGALEEVTGPNQWGFYDIFCGAGKLSTKETAHGETALTALEQGLTATITYIEKEKPSNKEGGKPFVNRYIQSIEVSKAADTDEVPF